MPESEDSSPRGFCIPTKLRCFFRVLMPVHIRERLLPIPRKFVSKFGKELSDSVILKGPSDKVWRVTLKKIDGEIWFQNGWQDFVEFYSLDKGYFLVFRYDGNSKFKVVVFDTSACEKEYPFPSENVQDSNIDKQGRESEEGSEGSVEILGVSPTCEPHWTLPKDVEGNQQQPTKRNGTPRLPPRRSIRRSVQPKVIKLENLTCETKSSKFRNELIKSESPCSESAWKKQKVESDDVSILSADGTRSNCTKGKSKIDEVSIHSESPSSKPITSPNEARHDCISSNGDEGDNLEPTKMLSNIQELLPSVCHKSIQFTESDLTKSTEDFDSHCFEQKCRFEELSACRENQRTELKEHIPSSKSDYSLRQAHDIGSYSRKSKDKFESHCFEQKNGIEELSTCLDNQRTEPNEHISSSKSDYPSTQAEGRGCYSFLSKRRPVTTKERDRAFQAANAFKSSNPFFKILMGLYYVYKGFQMYIPTKFVRSYLSRELKNIALQVSSGKRWLVGCTFKANTLVISKGWPKFVLENNLEEGDVCVFELLKMEETELKVHIFRVVEEVVPLLKLRRKKLESKQR